MSECNENNNAENGDTGIIFSTDVACPTAAVALPKAQQQAQPKEENDTQNEAQNETNSNTNTITNTSTKTRAPLTPIKPASSRLGPKKGSKTPKRPHTAYKARGFDAVGSEMVQIKAFEFDEIKSILSNLNFELTCSNLDLLEKEEILMIFVFLLTRIDEKYLFDVKNRDFNRSFLTIKHYFRELNLPTTMSKQAFIGSFKKPLLTYYTYLLNKVFEVHGGKEALFTKEFVPFEQLLAKFKTTSDETSQSETSNNMKNDDATSHRENRHLKQKNVKSLRSRRQSVPTQLFLNRNNAKTPQKQTKQVQMMHVKQVDLSTSSNSSSHSNSNLSNKENIDTQAQTNTNTNNNNNNVRSKISSSDVAVTRPLTTSTPNASNIKNNNNNNKSLNSNVGINGSDANNAINATNKKKRGIRRARMSCGGVLISSNAKRNNNNNSNNSNNMSENPTNNNNNNVGLSRNVKTPRNRLNFGNNRRRKSLAHETGSLKTINISKGETPNATNSNSNIVGACELKNENDNEEDVQMANKCESGNNKESTVSNGQTLENMENKDINNEVLNNIKIDATQSEVANEEETEDEDIDMAGTENVNENGKKMNINDCTNNDKQECGNEGNVSKNGQNGEKSETSANTENSGKRVKTGTSGINGKHRASGHLSGHMTYRGNVNDVNNGNNGNGPHTTRVGKSAALEAKLAQFTKENTRLETELKQQKMLMLTKVNEIDKQRRELIALKENNKLQKNQIESTKMVQKLIEEKNETIKLLALQQSQQAKEMDSMRKKIEALTFEKEQQQSERLRLKSELEELQKHINCNNCNKCNKNKVCDEFCASEKCQSLIGAMTPSPVPPAPASTTAVISSSFLVSNENENENNLIKDFNKNDNENENENEMDNEPKGESKNIEENEIEMKEQDESIVTQNDANASGNGINSDLKKPNAHVRSVRRMNELARPKSSFKTNENEMENNNNNDNNKKKVLKIANKNFESYIRGKKLNDLRMVDLRLYLKANRLSLYGTKDEMVARIEDHYFNRFKK